VKGFLFCTPANDSVADIVGIEHWLGNKLSNLNYAISGATQYQVEELTGWRF